MSNKAHTDFFDLFFKDKHGKIVIWQFPNIPLATWILLSLLALLIKHGNIHSGIHGIAQAALLAWAYLEVTMGASFFRRILGGLILLNLLVGFFR